MNRYFIVLPTTSPYGYSTPSDSPVLGGEQFPRGGQFKILRVTIIIISPRSLTLRSPLSPCQLVPLSPKLSFMYQLVFKRYQILFLLFSFLQSATNLSISLLSCFSSLHAWSLSSCSLFNFSRYSFICLMACSSALPWLPSLST